MALYEPEAHLMQLSACNGDKENDDEEKVPAGHAVHEETVVALLEGLYVPEGQNEQAFVPLMYVLPTQAVVQEEDPAAEYLLTSQGMQVAELDAPEDFEEVPAGQGVHTVWSV